MLTLSQYYDFVDQANTTIAQGRNELILSLENKIRKNKDKKEEVILLERLREAHKISLINPTPVSSRWFGWLGLF